MVGTIDVQPPYDWYFGQDFFTQQGKDTLQELMTDPLLACEHWAPCCKLSSRARGRPIHLPDGRVVPGGEREKWHEFRNNIPAPHQYLNKACPGHVGLKGYSVTEDEDGHLVYDTSKEEDYPSLLCKAYARGLKEQFVQDGHFARVYHRQRINWYTAGLNQSTEMLREDRVQEAMANYLAKWEVTMSEGEEMSHLRQLLSQASYRGTDVRAYVVLGDAEQDTQEVPYPALWREWKTILSIPRGREAHITIVALVKHRSRSADCCKRRWFLIVDSMVTRGALAKGWSPSRRLNRLLRRQAATQLAMDSSLFPLWTISRWNFSDDASHRYEK